MKRANRSHADSLIERFDGFAYDYQMHCVCGRTSRVPADVYWERQSIDALAPCEHCGADIHFGSAVAALRDPDDPALSNDNVANFAWYHTKHEHVSELAIFSICRSRWRPATEDAGLSHASGHSRTVVGSGVE